MLSYLFSADVLPVETLSPTKSFMAATEFTVEGQLVPREIPKVEACHVCNRALDHTDEGEAPHLLSHATVYFQESSTVRTDHICSCTKVRLVI